jgi:threonyl-tRNA synthetase
MIKITLPDGSVREFDQNVVTPFEVAGDISKGLQKKSLAAKVEGKVVDMDFPIEKDSELSLLTFEDEDGEDTFRHSSSHIMAQAVKNLFPGTKIAIGPAIKDGFYYDFDSEHVFTPEDLEKIEKEMERIVKEDNKFERKEMPRPEAIKLFQELGEDYKVELINDLPEDAKISIYTDGGFTDLCAGPHLPSTGHVKAFKLLNVAGAYWRGNSDNKMLQRIYGTHIKGINFLVF